MNKSYQKRISILPAAALLAVGLLASAQAFGQSSQIVECYGYFNANNFASCSTPELVNSTPKVLRAKVMVAAKTGLTTRFDAYLSIYKRTQGGSATPTRVVTRSFIDVSSNYYDTNYTYSGTAGIYHARASVSLYDSDGRRIWVVLSNA